LHDLDLGPLAAVDVCRKIKYFSILTGAGCLEQIRHHRQRARMMLDHSGQKQLDDGRVRVGCRGAPGRTTFGSDRWAKVVVVIKRANRPACKLGQDLKENDRIALLDKSISAYQKTEGMAGIRAAIKSGVNAPFRLLQVTVT